MKTSNYNLFIKKANATICYNSFSDTYLILPNQIYESFKVGDIESFIQNYPQHSAALIENGFLIEDSKDELSEIRFINKKEAFAGREHFLTIYPTQDCNLKCWYCYESHVIGSRMSFDVQERIIKYIQNKVDRNEFDSLQVTFFGGEPMTDFDNIAYPLGCKMKEIIEKAGKKIHTFFVTNGTLINENNINKLQEINAVFQITLDGEKDKHDSVRKLKEGDGATYDKIIKSLYYINNNLTPPIGIERNITLRINYDSQTLKNINSIVEDIKGLDRKKVSIHLERVWQTLDERNEEQTKIFMDTIKLFMENGFRVNFGSFGIKSISCPAEMYSHAVINYDGLVYKCNGRNLTKETSEGILEENGEISWNLQKQVERLGKVTFENNKCLKCKMLPKCMGPCSQKNIENNWENISSVCTMNLLETNLNDYLLMDLKRRTMEEYYLEQ